MSDGPARVRSPRRGNQIWPVPTPDGVVLQKLYAARDAGPSHWMRLLVERIARQKTPTTVNARWRTERMLLATWRAAGCDVPEDRSARHPAYVHGTTTLLEFIDGKILGKLLASDTLTREQRDDLLHRFAAAWGRRHALALDTPDVRLIQEHGTFLHVIGAGDRLVTIDLEQAFTPRRDLMPLVAKEIVAYVRSLAKLTAHDVFRADIEAIVEAYPRREVLEAAVREYLDSPSPLRRAIWALDRRLRDRRDRERGRTLGKYTALEVLQEVLESDPDPVGLWAL